MCPQRVCTPVKIAPLSYCAHDSSSDWHRLLSKRRLSAPLIIQALQIVPQAKVKIVCVSLLSEMEALAVAGKVVALWCYFENLGVNVALWTEYAELSEDMQCTHRPPMIEAWSNQ